MKKLVMALALAGAGGSTVFTTGCVEVERGEFDSVKDKLDKIELETKNKNELQVHLFNELVQKHGALAGQVAQLDILVRALQSSVSSLEDRVKVLERRPQPPDGPPTVNGPGPQAKLEEILLQVERTITELRQGKIKAEEATAMLHPYASQATPRLLDELAGAVTKFDYAKQLESILSKFPPADLKTPIQKALTQRGLRESAARIIGQTRNPELGKVLEEHADSLDEDFRLVVGESLVLCRNPKGIAILVICLRSAETTTRTIAISALRRLNRGQDLSYRAQHTNEENAAAIKSWEDWAEKYGKTIFD
jgi:hypothetical protein